jgi:glycosyltransferase involved in cell wall biosynthesis
MPAGALALRALSREHDLVHVFSVRSAILAALAQTRRPLVMHVLTPEPGSYDAVAAPFADAILCNSRATAARFPSDRAQVVYNGIPEPHPRTPGLGSSPRRRTIGVIGSLCSRKGQLDVLPALETVIAQRDDVDVVFVGRAVGPVAAALRDRARTAGDRIRVLGFVPDAGDLLAELALVVVPSRSEGFGRVAVESLRAGVPVLASRTGGLIEALEGLVDPWLPADRGAWAERILRELDRPTHRPDELRAVGRRFDPGSYVDQVLDVYGAVLAASPRAAATSPATAAEAPHRAVDPR